MGCYEGPPGTEGIGICKAGTQTKVLWSKRFGDAASQYLAGDTSRGAVAVDSAGNCVIGGSLAGTIDFGGGDLVSQGSVDVFVAKFDKDGTHQWSKRFGDSLTPFATGVGLSPSGEVVLFGTFNGS